MRSVVGEGRGIVTVTIVGSGLGVVAGRIPEGAVGGIPAEVSCRQPVARAHSRTARAMAGTGSIRMCKRLDLVGISDLRSYFFSVQIPKIGKHDGTATTKKPANNLV